MGQLLRVSRPRFWMYLLGPFMIALAATSLRPPLEVWLLGLYLTLPANLLIYGVNDLFDVETDRLNPKKQDYESLLHPEQRRGLVTAILVLNVPFLALVPFLPHAWPWLLVFLVTGVGYSAPPIRAKARPVVDAAFNILYVAPGLAAYATMSGSQPPVSIVLAALLWCMAMHAYSAVPDIDADREAGLATVATRFGRRGTLLLCGAAYAAAALLALPSLGVFALIAGLVYLAMIALSLRSSGRSQLFALYRRFPLLNTVLGGALFVVTGVQHQTWPFA
ncbi:4-hydroxybenzoate polyprenyltransferase [Microlunatus sagamiharensis]|uniref:4-hydroxybenzoate polyprenyltransferase n=1 Tax=Microlunatus sagamiharensis TaxID=546874 RepID=A0A1H2MLA6_9ACTN|nr:prenyltransferase [Microlunatus sagamiharensis]SDU93969.1 4-hydroxybenzoate polyprenyltransferase [Microlunatus sagamiharensis]